MTQEAPASPPSVRLATWIPEPLDRRLRVLAATSRRSVAAVLADLLASALPSAEELANEVHQSPDSAFWDSAAAGCLRALTEAAALAGDPGLVRQWAAGDVQPAIDVLSGAGRSARAADLRVLTNPGAPRTAVAVRMALRQQSDVQDGGASDGR